MPMGGYRYFACNPQPVLRRTAWKARVKSLFTDMKETREYGGREVQGPGGAPIVSMRFGPPTRTLYTGGKDWDRPLLISA